jgi:hypothetical protein
MVKALNSVETDWSKGSHIIEDARFIMKTFLFCEIKYVGREGNNVAHNLAKLVACLCLECPDCISKIIRVEQMLYLIEF